MAKKKKPQLIRHILILDRSGSMNDPADPGSDQTKGMVATAGIKRYVEEQQGDGALFTVWEFDSIGHDVRVVKIHDAVPTFSWTCHGRGGTPLLDATGTILRSESATIAALPEDQKPDRVFAVVSTDGLENTSRDWSKSSVGKVIAERTAAGWDVVFIGADFDAFAEAGSMGYNLDSVLRTNTATKGAYANAFAATSAAVTRAHAGGQSVSYSTTERKLAEEGDSSKVTP